MLVKLFFIFICTFVFLGCSSKHDVYDLKNYFEYKVDSSKGMINARYYQCKFDNRRNYVIYYWKNGKVLSHGFIFNGLKDGVSYIYFYNGKIESIRKFNNGIKVDTSYYYDKEGYVKEIEIYRHDSLIKIETFKHD